MSTFKIRGNTASAWESISAKSLKAKKVAPWGYSRHRGVGTENTVQSLVRAHETGFDYCELDFNWTSDDKCVMVHGGSIGGLSVSEHTLAELQVPVLGRDMRFGELHAITLEDALKIAYFIGQKLVVDVHGTIDTSAHAEHVTTAVHRAGMQDNVVYLCGSAAAMEKILTASNYKGTRVHFCTTNGDSIPSDLSAFKALQSLSDHIGFNANASETYSSSDFDRVAAAGMELSWWNVTASNFNACAASNPMFMTTDLSMGSLKNLEKTYLDSLTLW